VRRSQNLTHKKCRTQKGTDFWLEKRLWKAASRISGSCPKILRKIERIWWKSGQISGVLPQENRIGGTVVLTYLQGGDCLWRDWYIS
jgi:hypothetical protein